MINIIVAVAITVFSIISVMLATVVLVLTWTAVTHILQLPWGKAAGCILDKVFYWMLDMILGKHTCQKGEDNEGSTSS